MAMRLSRAGQDIDTNTKGKTKRDTKRGKQSHHKHESTSRSRNNNKGTKVKGATERRGGEEIYGIKYGTNGNSIAVSANVIVQIN
jgi:hypothetical protein